MSSSSGSSASDSDSSSDSEEERRKKEKKEKKRKREKEAKREKKEKKGKKSKKESKKEKREKKDKKSKKSKKSRGESSTAGGTMAQWGKYGILREGDMYSKQEEFFAWLSEVKGVPQEALRPYEIKEHFASFCEDYNTATLPSEKYYNLAKWYAGEQERKAKAEADGSALYERTSFDDEAERRAEIQRGRAKKESAVSNLMAKAMHGNSHLVQDMKDQEESRMKMQMAYKTSDTSTARELAQKLDPSFVSEAEMRATWGTGGGPARKARKPQKS